MKAIILAGGYATRLMPLTKYIPKSLLPVAGKPVIDYIIEQLNKIEDTAIIVSTNKHYENNFRYWLRGFLELPKEIKIVTEFSNTEKEKLGAVAAIRYIIQKENILNDDLLVVAGDNIFEFNLKEFIDFYKKINKPLIALHKYAGKENSLLKRYGLGILDADQKVIGFQEKPLQPASKLIAMGCYLYPASSQHYLHEYLEEGRSPDAPGYFIEWLHKKTEVYGFITGEPWYDIGSMDSYEKVNESFKDRMLISNPLD